MRKQNRDKVLSRFLDKTKRDIFKFVKIEENYLVDEDYLIYTDGHILGIIPANWTPETSINRNINNTPYKFPNYAKVIPDYKKPVYNTEFVDYSLVSTLRKRGDKVIYLWFENREMCFVLENLYHIMQLTHEDYLKIEAEENEPLKAATIRAGGAVFIVSPCMYNENKRERRRVKTA
jgi:hypothetical protein